MKRAKLVAFEAFCLWPIWGPIALVMVLSRWPHVVRNVLGW